MTEYLQRCCSQQAYSLSTDATFPTKVRPKYVANLYFLADRTAIVHSMIGYCHHHIVRLSRCTERA